MTKSINAAEILKERYGERGSLEREAFREEAFANYFGEILKYRRKELQLSQEKLAEMVGKKRPYISRVENGEDIRLSTFALLAKALGLSIQIKVET